MELTSLCPYCGQEMQRGVIPSERDTVTWCPCIGDGDSFDTYQSVTLSRGGLLSNQMASAYRCESCGVLVVRVPGEEEMKHPFVKAAEKLGRSLERWGDEQEARREQRRAEKEQEEKEKAREARGKKDPWEI